MSELDPTSTVRSALGGIKEALKTGREIKETANEVNRFLDEEAKARVAFKKRQQQAARRGDTVWVDARQEWDIIRKMREAEAAMYKDVEQEFGKQAVAEVKALVVRLRRDHRELHDEFYRERIKSRKEWGGILLVAAIVYGFLKATGAW